MTQTRWGHFPDPYHATHLADDRAVLDADFTFRTPDGVFWTAPAGMVFDGTSVPSLLWTAFRESPFTGHAAWPAVVHDAGCKGVLLRDGSLYRPAGLRDGRVHGLFYAGMRARGASPLKAWMFYRAVWSFGMVTGGYTG